VEYRSTGESGPDHCKVFAVEAIYDGKTVTTGSGTSKKKAQQQAAKAMLELMDEGQLAGIDTRPEKALKPGQTGEGYRGVERRSGEPLEMTKELEDLSHRIRDIYASEEHDLLDTLGEAQAIQKFESNAAAKLVKNDGCLIILDIDNFSRLNHRFGFLCGDACLHLIAETLVGFRNLMVCRYEGDSFLAYADQIQSEEEAVEMIRELREELKKSLGTLETLSGVTISCGLSLSVISGRKFAKLLHCSEMALAIVKKENKGSYEIYHEREDEEILASAKDLDNLSSMIEREYSYKGAFDLEYAEFGRVYELIRNLGNRNAQTVQLVLFTILFNDNADMPISDRTMVMKYLESAINNTVRKVDVTARFSSTQRIVLFTNLKDKDKDMVIGRVVKEFYRMISDNTFRLVYVSKNINLQELRSR
jgi:diguanylate cyclase (GGDEF)-like protein